MRIKIFSLNIFVLLLNISKVIATSSPDYFNNNIVAESQPISSVNQTAVDILWDFEAGLEGWAAATYSEMHAEVYHEDSQIIMRTLSPNAFIPSPHIHFEIGERQILVMRYRYIGSLTYGKIKLFGSCDGVDIMFPIIGDGQWHLAYVRFYSHAGQFDKIIPKCQGNITKIYIHPTVLINESKDRKGYQDNGLYYIDWIRLVRGPIIESVLGCSGGRLYSNTRRMENTTAFVSLTKLNITENLEQYVTNWHDVPISSPEIKYAMSYNCLRQGGERVTIRGSNFGMYANVFIGGRECTNVIHNTSKPQEELSCLTPAMGLIDKADVTLKNAFLPGLEDTAPYFMYAVEPPPPVTIFVSNVAARSVDLSWNVGGDLWQQLTYTGFRIQWKPFHSTISEYQAWMDVGNITTTTVRGLNPNTYYIFSISGIVDDQGGNTWKELDFYGRRKPLEGIIIGNPSNISAHTLAYDIQISYFNANTTQNSGQIFNSSSFGPSGIHGEGHYGLVFVGDASIANCNASSVCCDYIDQEGNCALHTLYCMPWFELDFTYDWEKQPFFDEDISKFPGGGKVVESVEDIEMMKVYDMKQCGPELRLTGSARKQVGAVWYPRQVDVAEGFETMFTFRISNPSFRCNNLDDVHTRCRSRGADGFAFVIQNNGLGSIGSEGHNMGYDIPNSISIEFDTYYNHDMVEPYENHISIHTRGSNSNIKNSAHQRYSLYSTTSIPDLTDGVISVRILYRPTFEPEDIVHPTFGSYPHLATNSTWIENGLGMIYIFVARNDERQISNPNRTPVLITPVNLSNLLNLKQNRKAWVGFTSATGVDTWQTHDILNWNFTSLRLDSDYMRREFGTR